MGGAVMHLREKTLHVAMAKWPEMPGKQTEEMRREQIVACRGKHVLSGANFPHGAVGPDLWLAWQYVLLLSVIMLLGLCYRVLSYIPCWYIFGKMD
jgi:hypothetical protein